MPSKISDKTRKLYEERDKAMDNDPDAPVLAPEMWANGVRGKYYKVRKQPVTVRVDMDVLEWLKSQGEGHLTKINQILRERMLADLKRAS
jgi:uncharacterized protein (DUF4415 family)